MNCITEDLKVFEIHERQPIYVFVRGKKNIPELSKFGDIVFISSQKSYACIYVDLKKSLDIVRKLKKIPFVKYIKLGRMSTLSEDFSVSFEEINEELKEKNKTGS
ncbi:MAG: DUF2129 domain-containing protein [Lactovum sp.]